MSDEKYNRKSRRELLGRGAVAQPEKGENWEDMLSNFLLHSAEQHVMLTLPRPIWFRHITIFAISLVPVPLPVPVAAPLVVVVVNFLGLVGAYRV